MSKVIKLMKKTKNKKIFRDVSLRHTLIGFVLTFIFTKILGPLLEFLYASFLNVGGSFIGFVSNSTYKSISNGFSEQGTMFLLYILFLSSCFLINYLPVKLREYYNAFAENLIESEDSISSVASSKTSASTVSSSTPSDDIESIESSLECLERNINEMKTSLKNNSDKISVLTASALNRMKRTCWLYFFFLMGFFVFFSFMYGRQVFIHNAITVTMNNIEIVSPYIPDENYKMLKSEFHSINSFVDYENLESKLSKIADDNNLRLKK